MLNVRSTRANKRPAGVFSRPSASATPARLVSASGHSITRIDEGVRSGKVVMTNHMDYLDYTPVIEQLADVQAVYWAIGTSIRNVDDETYSVIHIDFPVRFVEQWLQASRRPSIAFHYISPSDISEDSSMHWAREKARAEIELFAAYLNTVHPPCRNGNRVARGPTARR